jgi:hypothetical protein
VPVISAPVRHEFEASLDTQRNFVLKKKIKNHNKDTNKMHKKNGTAKHTNLDFGTE